MINTSVPVFAIVTNVSLQFPNRTRPKSTRTGLMTACGATAQPRSGTLSVVSVDTIRSVSKRGHLSCVGQKRSTTAVESVGRTNAAPVLTIVNCDASGPTIFTDVIDDSDLPRA